MNYKILDRYKNGRILFSNEDRRLSGTLTFNDSCSEALVEVNGVFYEIETGRHIDQLIGLVLEAYKIERVQAGLPAVPEKRLTKWQRWKLLTRPSRMRKKERLRAHLLDLPLPPKIKYVKGNLNTQQKD
jgi:hypothetical protein